MTVSLQFDNPRAEAAMTQVRNAINGTPYASHVYLVGGAVRDLLMGLPIKDLDFMIDIPAMTAAGHDVLIIDAVKEIARRIGCFREGSNPVVFPRFGTAKLTLRSDHGPFEVEFVAPRVERYTEGSRKPETQPGTLKDDAFRRDFTINTMFVNVFTNELTDLTGMGQIDLAHGMIRTPMDPNVIFREDPLRMLRAIRFVVKFGFDMHIDTYNGLKANVSEMSHLSMERIQEELGKILVLPKPSIAFQLMKDTGLLPTFLPELQACVGVTQNAYHKHDVFEHILEVVDNTPPVLAVRLAALLHDIGKPATRTEDATTGKVRFIGHDRTGAEMTVSILNRLRYSNDVTAEMRSVVFHHMGMKFAGDDLANLKDKSLRKLIFRCKTQERLDTLFDLMHADNISHADEHNMPNQIPGIRARIADWDLDAVRNTVSVLDGTEIEALGAKGKLIGDIKARILEKVLENPAFSKADGTMLAKNMIRNQEQEKSTASPV